MKKAQRINESQLRAIVAESVKKVLNETQQWDDTDYDAPSQQTHLMEPLKLLLNGYRNYMWDWNVNMSDISFGEYCEMLREKFQLPYDED